MTVIRCYGYVEDPPSAEVAKKIVEYRNEHAEGSLAFIEGFPHVTKGFGKIKKMAPRFLAMAENGLVTFTVTDLDKEACPPELIKKWFSIKAKPAELPRRVIFRVAVREIEAWILADQFGCSAFLGIPEDNFPSFPDTLNDPKEHLLSIIRKKGKKKWLREMLPTSNSQIGPMYNIRLCEFVKEAWSPERASASSPSLARAINSLLNFK
ncbi:MAG: hypothetical protein V1816_09990 [Pseudomonadota bacterium]